MKAAMKFGWSKLDKIEMDCEKINLKNDGPTFFFFFFFFSSLSQFSLKQVIIIRLRNHLCLPFKWDSIFYLIFDSHVWVQSSWKNDTGKNGKKNSLTQPFQYQIAGLQVTSRRPCWWSRSKAFLSAEKWTLFWWKFNRKISFVLTTNMAPLSRGCTPRTARIDYFTWVRSRYIVVNSSLL